jgi:hypothetical protein
MSQDMGVPPILMPNPEGPATQEMEVANPPEPSPPPRVSKRARSGEPVAANLSSSATRPVNRQQPSCFIRVTRVVQLGEGTTLPPHSSRASCAAVLQALGFAEPAISSARSITALRSGDLALTFRSEKDATKFLCGKDRFLRGTPVWANYWTPPQRIDLAALKLAVASATAKSSSTPDGAGRA